MLQSEDDAATQILGEGWRIPKWEEWRELFENTTHEWTTVNDVLGFLFTGKNQYSSTTLFMPATGYMFEDNLIEGFGGYYWTSSVEDYFRSNYSKIGEFKSNGAFDCFGYWERYMGLPIRAIYTQ